LKKSGPLTTLVAVRVNVQPVDIIEAYRGISNCHPVEYAQEVFRMRQTASEKSEAKPAMELTSQRAS